ncbi:Antiholin-like protein LrgA [Lactiplantibacillus plantarum]|uniref:CidA/LrgA family protein n=1 Tax=Lactiplantibacillus plantarum TaxID=1590 RepID=UPI0007B555AE|nr:CidA/LrgA family protein [Lactiplantibacillus plantarum]KZU31987.1 Antiholin-like protein LrgA [Lactiplantibacillus plantarum]KZU75861.1 Antiholin-like protein LrgA [Lactiplantibacillus plantarum]
MSNKKKPTLKGAAPLLVQFGIYTAILFVSNGISSFFPIGFPVPAPVIGLILLYLLLTLNIVKLEWISSVGTFLISIIGFLFVPSGISLAANLKIMQQQGLKLIFVIILSTIILLVVTTYTAKLLIWGHQWLIKRHHQPLVKTDLTTVTNLEPKERD